MKRYLLACALIAAAGSAAAANDGLLDSSFGVFSTGRNLIAIDQGGTNADQLADMLVAADGSIFLVGTSRGEAGVARFSISKLSRDGFLDLSFGTNGSVLSELPNLIATHAKFDNSGNILISGSRGFVGIDRDFAVCRFNQQGQPVVFSGAFNACVTVPFDIVGGSLTDFANDVVIEPNGNIILVGVAGISATNSRAAAVRLLPTGLRDDTFGTNGRKTYEPSVGFINQFNAIARRPDGKYIAVGEFGDKSSINGVDSLFARLTTTGALDPSYENGAGYSAYPQSFNPDFQRYDAATQIIILGNGNMLMGGNAQRGPTTDRLYAQLYRINPTNSQNDDQSFGTGGGQRIFGKDYSFEFGEMFLQSDGKILVVGTNRETSAVTRRMRVTRLTADGNLDLTFGTFAFSSYIDFITPGNLDYGIAGALQNGRILVAGHSLNTAPSNYDLGIAGLSLDLIFADHFDGQQVSP